MEHGQEARVALDDVRRRQEAVARELGRHRPTWWMTALYVVGMYTVMATIELGRPFELAAAACGFGIMAVGIGLAIRRAGRSRVGEHPGFGRLWQVAAFLAWLAAIFGVFWLVLQALPGSLAEWQAPFLAAVPAAVVAWLFALWMWRITFGPRPSPAKEAE